MFVIRVVDDGQRTSSQEHGGKTGNREGTKSSVSLHARVGSYLREARAGGSARGVGCDTVAKGGALVGRDDNGAVRGRSSSDSRDRSIDRGA